jgi:hypothetical protein
MFTANPHTIDDFEGDTVQKEYTQFLTYFAFGIPKLG